MIITYRWWPCFGYRWHEFLDLTELHLVVIFAPGASHSPVDQPMSWKVVQWWYRWHWLHSLSAASHALVGSSAGLPWHFDVERHTPTLFRVSSPRSLGRWCALHLSAWSLFFVQIPCPSYGKSSWSHSCWDRSRNHVSGIGKPLALTGTWRRRLKGPHSPSLDFVLPPMGSIADFTLQSLIKLNICL